MQRGIGTTKRAEEGWVGGSTVGGGVQKRKGGSLHKKEGISLNTNGMIDETAKVTLKSVRVEGFTNRQTAPTDDEELGVSPKKGKGEEARENTKASGATVTQGSDSDCTREGL